MVEDYRTILPLTHAFVEPYAAGGFPLTRIKRQDQDGVGYSR